MTALKEAATAYTKALTHACAVKRQLMTVKQALIQLDAELSETIAEAKDEAGKALYSNADARKAALLNHPQRKELAERLHDLELSAAEADTATEVAKVLWQTERLLLAAEKGVVSL